MFEEASPQPRLDPGQAQVRYPMDTSKDRPPLLIAEDRSLAINKTENEPKEFYAEDQVVNDANRDLHAQMHPAELDNSGGHSLTVGTHTLKIVRPKKNGVAINIQADEFARFTYDICIKMALEIMGSRPGTVSGYKNTAVLGAGAGASAFGGERAQLNPDMEGVSIPELARLARYLTQKAGRPVTLAEAAQAMQDQTFDGKPIGKEYGTLLGQGALDANAQTLGVNQFAHATRVGQGYVTQTMRPSDAKANKVPDYSEMQSSFFGLSRSPTNRKGPWGYHYAAVVAMSLDKLNSITLENYNRGPETKRALAELREQLEKQYREQYGKKVLRDLQQALGQNAQDRGKIAQIQAELLHGAGATKEQAAAVARQITGQGGVMRNYRLVGHYQVKKLDEQNQATRD
jgi:hypothetical protein